MKLNAPPDAKVQIGGLKQKLRACDGRPSHGSNVEVAPFGNRENRSINTGDVLSHPRVVEGSYLKATLSSINKVAEAEMHASQILSKASVDLANANKLFAEKLSSQIDALTTQVAALTVQIQQLASKVVGLTKSPSHIQVESPPPVTITPKALSRKAAKMLPPRKDVNWRW